MAAAARKYAGLPDLDEAPDIFETPDLTEDNTTTAASGTLRTESRASSGSAGGGGGDEDGNDGDIDRHRLNQDRARARFGGSRVDASQADFSDRILPNGADKRSYLVKSSRRRRRKGRRRGRRQEGAEDAEAAAAAAAAASADDESTDEDDEDEDDDTPEGLRRKLARLTREAAELKADMERLQASGQDQLDQDPQKGVQALETSLGSLNKTILNGQTSAQGRLAQKLGATKLSVADADDDAAKGEEGPQKDGMPGYTIAYAPSYDSAHALARAAAFDGRLAALESALGLDHIPLPTQDQSSTARPAYPRPVLPALDILDKQLAVLASSSGSQLETIGKRVQQLTRDAERLAEARRDARDAHEALEESWSRNPRGTTGGAARKGSAAENGGGVSAAAGGDPDGGGLGLDDPETVAKINALHGALPTIESLAPVLPGLLDRLRSLRLIHADAAGASKSLGELERRQGEVDEEIKEWRESLKKVEGALAEGEEGIQENMKVVEAWVKELEGRVSEL